MEVVCGSYESMVFGCTLRRVKQEYEFELSFCDNSHNGNIKSVAISENGLLATGSSDEYIKLKNLKTRKEIGSISQHDGSISALTFYGKSHLFSASEDGTIIIWKVGSWESLRVLRGHKAAVYDVAIHPSGKIAVSVGKDKSMRTWNLVTGKCAFVTNIKLVADQVKWMPNGERFLVVHDRCIDIYGVQSGVCEHSIKHNSRINAISFIEDGILLASGEGGVVYFYNTEDYAKVYEFPTETVRVKGMHCCLSEEGGGIWLVTGSADGMLKLWTLTSQQGEWSHHLESTKDFGYRITSMAVRVDRRKLDENTTNNNKATTSEIKRQKKKAKEGNSVQKVAVVEEINEDEEDGDEGDDEGEEQELLTRKASRASSSALSTCPPRPINSVEASILDFMTRKKQSREKVKAEEEETDDETDQSTDQESIGQQDEQESSGQSSGQQDKSSNEGSQEEEVCESSNDSAEDSSSDDSVDQNLMSYVDCLDSIDETDEDDDLPSRKGSKRSVGRVSAKHSKKSLASQKSSRTSISTSKSLASVNVSLESLAVTSKASRKLVNSPSTSAKKTRGKKRKDPSKANILQDSPPEGTRPPTSRKKKRKLSDARPDSATPKKKKKIVVDSPPEGAQPPPKKKKKKMVESLAGAQQPPKKKKKKMANGKAKQDAKNCSNESKVKYELTSPVVEKKSSRPNRHVRKQQKQKKAEQC